MSSETQQTLRIRDAKSSVIYKFSGGTALTAIGTSIAIESYWHGLNGQMLVIGAVIGVIGLYFVYRSSQEAVDKYHAMTHALFPKT